MRRQARTAVNLGIIPFATLLRVDCDFDKERVKVSGIK